ncbi:MAG: hypothetical protein ACM3WV_02760 [Bacillota bacterium]
MRKVLTLFFTFIMMALFSFNTLGAFKASLGYVTGSWETDDYTEFVLGGQYLEDTCKIEGSYAFGGLTDYDGVDVSLLNIGGSYKVMAGYSMDLFVGGSYLIHTIGDASLKFETSALLLTIAAGFKMSDQMELGLLLGSSLSAAWKVNDSEFPGDVTVITHGLKFGYQISDSIGLAVGYQGITAALEGAPENINDFSLSLGASFNF